MHSLFSLAYIQLLPYMTGMCISGAVGALFGIRKGRSFIGFLLGALLGPLGWVLALGAKDLREKCPECLAPINQGASRCCHCGINLRKSASTPSTIKCPYCEAFILAKSLKPGDNTCPKCREVFSVA